MWRLIDGLNLKPESPTCFDRPPAMLTRVVRDSIAVKRQIANHLSNTEPGPVAPQWITPTTEACSSEATTHRVEDLRKEEATAEELVNHHPAARTLQCESALIGRF